MISLTAEERDHLADVVRKGSAPLGPDGLGVPVSVAVRLEMAELVTIKRGPPQTVVPLPGAKAFLQRGAW